VRSAIYADKSLSTLAHNVKIVTANGTVTLRGPVKTAAEKARVAELATNTAGVVRVDNQIDVKRK
jgi:osmotically-inducible protein OsmY